MQDVLLQVPADMKKVETQSNGKLKITFITQEGVQPEVRSKIIALHEAYGWLSFLAGKEKIEAEDLSNLPEIAQPEKGQKSKSVRLRGVLFRFWEQNGKSFGSSELHYDVMMEKIINHYKEKLT